MGSPTNKQLALQWGLVLGLITFSLVALIGIVFRVEPFVIAQRASCSAIATYFVAQLAVNTLLLNTRRKKR